MTHPEAVAIVADADKSIVVTPANLDQPHLLRLNKTNYDLRTLDEDTLRIMVAQNEH